MYKGSLLVKTLASFSYWTFEKTQSFLGGAQKQMKDYKTFDLLYFQHETFQDLLERLEKEKLPFQFSPEILQRI